jgi:hypothetical protein
MGRRLQAIFTGAIITSGMAISSPPARADLFTFDDIVYVGCTNFRCTNGASNFAAAFPGYTGGPGFSSSGYYQVLNSTNTNQQWSGLSSNGNLNNAPTYIFKQPGNGSSFGGEYIQNDPNFPATGSLQGTEGLDKLTFTGGWSSDAAGINGKTVDKVYTTSASGSSFQFYGTTAFGGFVPFTFNGFDLSGKAQNVAFEVLDINNKVLFTETGINLTNASDHVTVDIADAYKVLFTSGSSATDALYVDNVEINDPITTVPEPSSLAMLGVGLIGLTAIFRHRRVKTGQAAGHPL